MYLWKALQCHVSLVTSQATSRLRSCKHLAQTLFATAYVFPIIPPRPSLATIPSAQQITTAQGGVVKITMAEAFRRKLQENPKGTYSQSQGGVGRHRHGEADLQSLALFHSSVAKTITPMKKAQKRKKKEERRKRRRPEATSCRIQQSSSKPSEHRPGLATGTDTSTTEPTAELCFARLLIRAYKCL
jgi:hypothetical protein